MNLREIAGLIRPKRPSLRPSVRRLRASHDIDGLRSAAKHSSPRPVFDYVDGGADDEISVRANIEAFRRWRFTPRALVGVAEVDTSTALFGRGLELPLVLAPTGLTQMMHATGERAVARAAERHGLPYTLSTLGTTSITALAAVPHGDLWFQLYVGRNRQRTTELVAEATEAGYRALVVAVDTPVSGRRVRDLRNGLTLPPALNLRSLVDIGVRPGYWLRMLASPGMSFPNLNGPNHTGAGLTGARTWFDPSTNWADIEAIRAQWNGPLIVKGPLGPEDARRAVDLGVDGLQLSNHGGRQLDRTAVPLDLVPSIRAAVGPDVTIVVDSGVRNGTDIALAVALGADAAAIGRAYLYGLMAGGEAGVDHALTLLATEFQRTMQLLGVATVAELREHGPQLLSARP